MAVDLKRAGAQLGHGVLARVAQIAVRARRPLCLQRLLSKADEAGRQSIKSDFHNRPQPRGQVKILDFGLAEAVHAQPLAVQLAAELAA
jgi:hypothetical protein